MCQQKIVNELLLTHPVKQHDGGGTMYACVLRAAGCQVTDNLPRCDFKRGDANALGSVIGLARCIALTSNYSCYQLRFLVGSHSQ